MPPLNDFINISKHFQKNVLGAFPAVSYLCVGSLLAMLARPYDAPASDDFYEDCITVDVYYYGGCVPLFVTIRY
jgi:hypothetical protein